MACAKPNDCAPCSKCPDKVDPVLPRCDIALNDGVYPNATVVIEGGCIIEVREGTPLLYQPDNNCAGSGTGGGPAGVTLVGDQGPPGAAGTIEINTVTSLAPGAAPTVENIGTPGHAILNIGIPRGEPGAPAPVPVGANANAAGIIFENGVLKEPVPPAWPPVLDVMAEPVVGAGVTLMLTKGANGIVRVELSVQSLIDWFTGEINTLVSVNDAQQLQIDDLLTRVAALEAP